MPSVVQASIAAGQFQARETQTQNNLRTAQADRAPDGEGPLAADRGPASTLDVVEDASRVTGGEAPLSANPGGGVQGTATDSSADRLAAGRDLSAPQADANTLTQELAALGVNNQSGPTPAPESGQQGPEVLGAFSTPGAGADNPGPNAASPQPGPSTAPGLDGVPEPGDLVRG